MAEFNVIMKQWRRMCNDCTTTCRLFDGLCVAMPEISIQDLSDGDISEIEETVVAWAAEHPEPVYPTWWKYMCMIGVIPDTLGDKTLGEVTVERLMHINIPADIAEKLGIEPKEGTT